MAAKRLQTLGLFDSIVGSGYSASATCQIVPFPTGTQSVTLIIAAAGKRGGLPYQVREGRPLASGAIARKYDHGDHKGYAFRRFIELDEFAQAVEKAGVRILGRDA